MGQRIYLRIDGVDGGCGSAERRGWMEITNVSESISTHDGRANAAWHDISIARLSDRATPLLARAAAQGRRFPEALIEVCDGADEVKIRIRLADVGLRSWGVTAVRENPEPAPYENLSLTAASVEWTWLPQGPAPIRASFAPEGDPALRP